MNRGRESDDDALSQTLQARIDTICDRFEAAWNAGEKPRIEDYLADWEEPDHTPLLRELLLLELAYRAREGEMVDRNEYRGRFPADLGRCGHTVADSTPGRRTGSG